MPYQFDQIHCHPHDINSGLAKSISQLCTSNSTSKFPTGGTLKGGGSAKHTVTKSSVSVVLSAVATQLGEFTVDPVPVVTILWTVPCIKTCMV